MDDELDRAARRQKVSQRQGAAAAARRKPVGWNREAEAAASGAVGTTASSSSGSQVPLAPSGAATSSGIEAQAVNFKETVAVKFRLLVESGVPPNEAATQAIQLVRSEGAAPVGAEVPQQRILHEVGPESPVDDVMDLQCHGGPFTCFICVEGKGPEERFLPHRCAVVPETLCCKPCFVAWVESQIDNEAGAIKCCHCDLDLHPHILSRLVDDAHWQLYCDTTLQRKLKRDSSFIWCSKCSAGGWVDPGQPPSKCGWICPHCDNSFLYCPFCRREHGSLACKRFQQLRHEVYAGPKKTDDRESVGHVQRSAKMCPSCKMPIQKDGGCNFMDCPNCKRHFCWSCGRVLKGSHQKHECDAGFEGSSVVHKTPNGNPCVEFTRLFTNVLDIDHMELMNVDESDIDDLREMLVPGIFPEERSPLFVGPSMCDGELLLRLPFNFQKSMSWELTHILVRAAHPPGPNSYPPKTLALLPNLTSATFSDFELPTTTVVELVDTGNGVLLAPLEQYKTKGTFRRVTSLTLRFSVYRTSAGMDVDAEGADEDMDEDAQIYFNDLALFGVPSDSSAGSTRSMMWDDRANLIVSPALTRRKWGQEAEEEGGEKAPPQPPQEDDQDQNIEEDANPAAAVGRLPFPALDAPDHDPGRGAFARRDNP